MRPPIGSILNPTLASGRSAVASADRLRRDGPSLRATSGREEGERTSARIGLVRENQPSFGFPGRCPSAPLQRYPVLPALRGKSARRGGPGKISSAPNFPAANNHRELAVKVREQRDDGEDDERACHIAGGNRASSGNTSFQGLETTALSAAFLKTSSFSPLAVACRSASVTARTMKAANPPAGRGAMKYSADRSFALSTHVVAARNTTSLSTSSLDRADANLPLHVLESTAITSDAIARPVRSERGG